jgi:hypothetical protein
MGSIFGDVFIKVTHEDAYFDDAGVLHPARVRLIPLNPQHCVPVDENEILSRRGWLTADELTTDDQVLALDPESDELVWTDVQEIKIFDWDGPVHDWHSERFHATSTPDHRWLFETGRGNREFRTSEKIDTITSGGGARLIVAGGTPTHFPSERKYIDEFVELIGWVVTEGALSDRNDSFTVTQSPTHNPEFCARIERLAAFYRERGFTIPRTDMPDRSTSWYFPVAIGHEVRAVLGVNKGIHPEFLTSLTFAQAKLLYETMMDGDGDTRRVEGETLWQNNWEVMDSFQMLAMMLGKRSNARMTKRDFNRYDEPKNNGRVNVYQNRTHNLADLKRTQRRYKGRVWCPTTGTGTWVTRRKEVMQDGSGSKVIYLTGNCFPLPRWHPHDKGRLEEFKLKYKYWTTNPDGTRLVNTYVEVITSKEIREYVNDRLISQRPNPMGEIPIVHIAHRPAAGSPWGLGDLTPDFIGLQREYNEKAMEISDIINYHVSPITVITGGKPPNLVKGPSKIWGVDSDKAKVYNLEGGFAGLAPAEVSLERIKTTMCEMQGVPVTALGQEQAISNTSGVALSIQFMPTMQQFGITEIQYTLGLKEVCRLTLKTLFIFEPETVFYDPNTDGIMQEGQAPQVDISDFRVYDVDLEWAKPLPVDVILKLQEIQLKMELGLESKKGAMRILGEEFPDEKLKELFDEQIAELKQDAAKQILNAQAAAITMALTGMVPEGYAEQQPPPPNQDGTQPAPTTPPAQQSANLPQLPNVAGLEATIQAAGRNMYADIVQDAYGAKQSPRRDIDQNVNDTT